MEDNIEKMEFAKFFELLKGKSLSIVGDSNLCPNDTDAILIVSQETFDRMQNLPQGEQIYPICPSDCGGCEDCGRVAKKEEEL